MKNLLVLLTVIVFALAACSMGAQAGGDPPQENQTEIERNQEKWQNAEIAHYRYKLNLSCFCAFTQDMPLVIEVMDGKVVSMEYQTGNEIDATNRELFERYATIDRIFSELDADLAGAADEVTVTYDPTYGFPTQATIDFVKEATDDELYLTISDFEALP
jgi:glucose/arabinose dehydrogenase